MNFFVVAPYGSDPLSDAKRRIVADVASSLALGTVFGPHRRPLDENDSRITVQLLRGVDFVLADLSYERPSCYFEVGYAQALGKPVHLVAVNGTAIHQVLGRDSIEFYQSLADYESLITKILTTCKNARST